MIEDPNLAAITRDLNEVEIAIDTYNAHERNLEQEIALKVRQYEQAVRDAYSGQLSSLARERTQLFRQRAVLKERKARASIHPCEGEVFQQASGPIRYVLQRLRDYAEIRDDLAQVYLEKPEMGDLILRQLRNDGALGKRYLQLSPLLREDNIAIISIAQMHGLTHVGKHTDLYPY